MFGFIFYMDISFLRRVFKFALHWSHLFSIICYFDQSHSFCNYFRKWSTILYNLIHTFELSFCLQIVVNGLWWLVNNKQQKKTQRNHPKTEHNNKQQEQQYLWGIYRYLFLKTSFLSLIYQHTSMTQLTQVLRTLSQSKDWTFNVNLTKTCKYKEEEF